MWFAARWGGAVTPFLVALLLQQAEASGIRLKPENVEVELLEPYPETMMPDVALRFGDYTPKNFDNRFRGQISAREALQSAEGVVVVDHRANEGSHMYGHA